MEWQPIETAPKDKNVVMLANKFGVWLGYYNPIYQSGYAPKNPWSSLMMNHRYMGDKLGALIPTHWMPIPKGPNLA